ncbi:nidogen-like domain-containing protein [Galbitalea sp. SE-J8]|uniref:nidogen-like domain-containing protein n=1 Tax=Galbitalea sp. SE-J8 TaxID=3054952 RepID=UPI00259CA07F|nr:nidogen-like domain-containing protein [Galbitalea sp. SE-J8]MDM4763607.1 nidogen-like domain-containing protein [Galbitalea sp. SE-J8]
MKSHPLRRAAAVLALVALSLFGMSLPAAHAAGDATITGTVQAALGGPLGDVRVGLYPWNASTGAFSRTASASALTNGSGNYTFTGADSAATYALRFGRSGYSVVWLGGSTDEPTSIDPATSVSPRTSPTIVPTVTLAAGIPYQGFGTGAVQDLSYCQANTLQANDDDSTGAVPLGFAIDFYGRQFSSLYVNNNGNVTFGASDFTYTPYNLTSPDQLPRLAPLFSDVDTRGAGSWQVTYGRSPDSTAFCVNWVEVGYYGSHDDKLNSFQLIITSRSGAPGRTSGDFDATYNYDSIEWETGDASGGVGGYGGSAAAVGYTVGTGDPGTYFQLAGSLSPRSFLDGGEHALASNSRNSGTPGRYVYSIENASARASIGAITGVVHTADNHPVAGAVVNVCREDSASSCYYTTTDVNGRYLFSAVAATDAPGTSYRLVVSPPDSTLFGASTSAVVVAGQSTAVSAIVLDAPIPPPPGTSITGRTSPGSSSSSSGIPTVNWAETLHLQTVGPAGLTATYSVTFANCPTPRTGTLAEAPAGIYSVDLAELYPCHGPATVVIVFDAAAGSNVTPPAPVIFDIYIDPSGGAFDRWGSPLAGATVTLSRADNEGDVYTIVPNGSPIMSPGNRANPDTTTAEGGFHWDVSPGWYRITVSKSGYDTLHAGPWQVYEGHPVTDLQLVVQGGAAPAPVVAPEVSGTLAVGQPLAVSDGMWPSGLAVTGREWARDGVPIPGATANAYALVGADATHSISATITAARPGFAATSYTVQAGVVPVPPLSAPVLKSFGQVSAPGITGTVGVGQRLKVAKAAWPKGTRLAYVWKVGGKKRGSAASYAIRKRDLGKKISVTVTASLAGYASVTLTSKPTARVAKSFTKHPKPRISGAVRARAKVKVTVGSWLPVKGVHFTYRWFANGVALAHATKATYTIPRSLKGRKLVVAVTAKLTGYARTTVTSRVTIVR